MGLKSRQDHDNQSFESLNGNESARRVLVKNPSSAPIPVTPTSGLVLPKYDTGHGEKTSATQEVFTYFLDGNLVATLTIDYEDSSKEFVEDWNLVLP